MTDSTFGHFGDRSNVWSILNPPCRNVAISDLSPIPQFSRLSCMNGRFPAISGRSVDPDPLWGRVKCWSILNPPRRNGAIRPVPNFRVDLSPIFALLSCPTSSHPISRLISSGTLNQTGFSAWMHERCSGLPLGYRPCLPGLRDVQIVFKCIRSTNPEGDYLTRPENAHMPANIDLCLRYVMASEIRTKVVGQKAMRRGNPKRLNLSVRPAHVSP